MAPFTPFMAEEMYRNLMQGVPDAKESVHLENYPVADKSVKDNAIIEMMRTTRSIVTQLLKVRAERNIKIRQPLRHVLLTNYALQKEYLDIIREEVNVKSVFKSSYSRIDDNTISVSDTISVVSGDDVALPTNYERVITPIENGSVSLDITITPELKREGQARELIRYIQQARKKAGFNVDDRITLAHEGADDIFAAHGDLIAHETLATAVTSGTLPDADYTQTVTIDEQEVTLALRRAV